jgi:hypothetical protein
MREKIMYIENFCFVTLVENKKSEKWSLHGDAK